MFSIKDVHPVVRIVSLLAVTAAVALGLIALSAVIGAQPAHAAELQAQSVSIKLPDGNTVTVPDGSSIDLSGTNASSSSTTTSSTAKAKLTTAQKQANKAWKKSGLESYGKKYGWSLKKAWTSKSSTKAVRKAHFYYNIGSKQKFMDVIQTTAKRAGKWKTIYSSGQDGKTYSVKAFKWTLRHSAPK